MRTSGLTLALVKRWRSLAPAEIRSHSRSNGDSWQLFTRAIIYCAALNDALMRDT